MPEIIKHDENFCGGSNLEADSSSGITYCVSCGNVIEENVIVSEITFGEASSGAAIVQGSFVGVDQSHARTNGPYRKQSSLESREQTIANGRRRINALAIALNLSERHAETAVRYFTLAVTHNFIQGRRSQYVIASCLYIVCRLERTSHMLIDFSDILQINVFTLGSTFLKLVHILHITLPFADPSLYITRFAALLEFGAETHKVATDAIRLVQRMNRDWMQTGRRPAGICGACLLIAARMNNFRRSVEEIVHIVKVGDLTVRKRLEEFKATASGDLTVQDFRTIWLEQTHDPPSYLQGRRKERRRRDIGTIEILNDDKEYDTDVFDSIVENQYYITPKMWTETFLCEVLRWLQFSDDYTYQLPGFRKLNPITSIEFEEKFLNACFQLFLEGWKLGSGPEIQIPDIINNNLTNGILKYLNMTGRYAVAVTLFEKLRLKNSEIIPFLAKLYFLMDEEFIAVNLLNEILTLDPINYSSLVIQTEYLIRKNCYDLALQCAKKAISCAPSEFITWEILTQPQR
ncbi:hypothetical protein PCK2_000541 [Pneumocystis canis]|nr:hypothetical protein PCK2_000541 [Pneumocystis canis]